MWFAPSRPQLPVIELLSGTPGTPEDWTRAALADVAADAWAATHHGTAPILVMPDANGHFTGDTECVDGAHGRAETYLTADVRAWMVTHFRATPGRKAWVIGGASEGGYCALDLALRHPNQFATFLDFSGLDRPTASGGALRLFRGSQRELQLHSPRDLLASRQVGAPMAGWFEVGSRDGGTTHAVQAMADLSRRAGIDTTLCCSITPITRGACGGVASPMHCPGPRCVSASRPAPMPVPPPGAYIGRSRTKSSFIDLSAHVACNERHAARA